MVELRDVVKRLATRTADRSEATVQSDVRLFLLSAPLGLEENDLNSIVLEAPAGARRRIDVEVGFTVIEVKKDLRTGNVRSEAEEQLAGYVRLREVGLQQRYVGILTDGADWFVYHLDERGNLEEVSSHRTKVKDPDPEALAVWLEAVLATNESVNPTTLEIERRLGADSPAHALDFADLKGLYEASRDEPTVKVK
jgi:hypothetical protein